MERVQKCVQLKRQCAERPVWGEEIDALTQAFEEMTPIRRRYALGQLLFLGTLAQLKEAALQVEFFPR